MNLLKKLGRTDGAEIAEVALVLPLVFMFLLGIVWFGRAFSIYSTITQAAQRGAIIAARPSCATCGNTFPNTTEVDDAVFAVTDTALLDRNQMMPNPPAVAPTACPLPAPPVACAPTVSKISVCRNVVLNAPSSAPQCGVVISFKYKFKFFLPFTSLNLQEIDLAANAQSRMEN